LCPLQTVLNAINRSLKSRSPVSKACPKSQQRTLQTVEGDNRHQKNGNQPSRKGQPPGGTDTQESWFRTKDLLPDIDGIGQYTNPTDPFEIQATIQPERRRNNTLQQQNCESDPLKRKSQNVG